MSYLDVILGPRMQHTVMLDLDDLEFYEAKNICQRAMEKHDLHGFILRSSSDNNFHAVFDRHISTWEETVWIVASITDDVRKTGLAWWLIHQISRRAMTLRSAPYGDKPAPVTIYREGSQKDRIKKFLSDDVMIKQLALEILARNVVP